MVVNNLFISKHLLVCSLLFFRPFNENYTVHFSSSLGINYNVIKTRVAECTINDLQKYANKTMQETLGN